MLTEISTINSSMSARIKFVSRMLIIFGMISFLFIAIILALALSFLEQTLEELFYPFLISTPISIGLIIFTPLATVKFIQAGIDLKQGKLSGLKVASKTAIIKIVLYICWIVIIYNTNQYQKNSTQYFWLFPLLCTVPTLIVYLFLRKFRKEIKQLERK